MYKVKDKNELRQIILDQIIPLDTIDISELTDMNFLFKSIDKINGDISSWDTSKIISMMGLFSSSFIKPDISGWDVSSVINMTGMFEKSCFNGDISKWNTSSVKKMLGMFYASEFNGDISNWNVSSVEDMDAMFQNGVFNQDISDWDTSNVLSMTKIISGNSCFSQNLGSWDLSKVYNTKNIFDYSLYSFEQYEIDRKKYLLKIKYFENSLKEIPNINVIEFEF